MPHYLEEIGRGYVVFNIEEPTVGEIKKALKGLEGEKLRSLWAKKGGFYEGFTYLRIIRNIRC
jgi:PHP family Zn ribbon phosphoesterase